MTHITHQARRGIAGFDGSAARLAPSSVVAAVAPSATGATRARVGRTGLLGVLLSLVFATTAAAQPVPSCTSGNIDQFLGEPGSTTVTLTNTAPSGNIGYQPIVEVVLPAGMTFTGASTPILGALTPLANVVVPIGGSVTNPVTGEVLTGLTPGTTYLVLQPPIGSFPPEQPPVPFIIGYDLSGALQPDVVLSDPVTCVGISSTTREPTRSSATRSRESA